MSRDHHPNSTHAEVTYLYNIQFLICWWQYNMDIIPFHELTHISTLLSNNWTVKIKGNINLKSKNIYMKVTPINDSTLFLQETRILSSGMLCHPIWYQFTNSEEIFYKLPLDYTASLTTKASSSVIIMRKLISYFDYTVPPSICFQFLMYNCYPYLLSRNHQSI
jgi:hypothetical protein